jgi:hypothetical protein
MSIEKYNDLIGNITRDLPVCSIVPQPTTLPRAIVETPTAFSLLVLSKLAFTVIILRQIVKVYVIWNWKQDSFSKAAVTLLLILKYHIITKG